MRPFPNCRAVVQGEAAVHAVDIRLLDAAPQLIILEFLPAVFPCQRVGMIAALANDAACPVKILEARHDLLGAVHDIKLRVRGLPQQVIPVAHT